MGMAVAARALGVEVRIVGISPSPQDDAGKRAELAKVADEVARLLDLALTFSPEEFESSGEYVGEDYGVLTPGSREAVILAARTEGLLLDPVYTGKTFAALIDHIRQGQWKKGQTIVFVHTGGTPALFAYGEEILAREKE